MSLISVSPVPGTGPGAEKVLNKYHWLNEHERGRETEGEISIRLSSRESPAKTRK